MNKSSILTKSISGVLIIALSFCFSSDPAFSDVTLYKVYGAHGVVTFTNRAPRSGEHAEAFTPKKINFSTYSVGPFIRHRLHLEYSELIKEAGTEHKVDENLIRAVIHAESGFNPRARSPKGAMGLMQLMPGTAKLVGVTNAYEPRQNILGGASYLASLMLRFKTLSHAIAAYNAGPEAVDSYKGIPPFRETQDYVRRVTALYHLYRLRTKS